MYKVVGFIGVAITLALLAYTIELVLRTELFNHPTSIGSDVIVGFYLFGIIALVSLIFARRKRDFIPAVINISLVSVLVIVSVFLLLNLTGYVWHLEKSGTTNLLEHLSGSNG
jgi:glucan phosphoethanolaminetransferase (alkaline phosphatase superfamily)